MLLMTAGIFQSRKVSAKLNGRIKKKMSDIGLRHQADLAGKLTGGVVPACIQIAVEAEVAKTWVAQHLVWMLVNLLARQTPEISELELLFPEEIKPVDRLSSLVLMPPNSGSNIDLRT